MVDILGDFNRLRGNLLTLSLRNVFEPVLVGDNVRVIDGEDACVALVIDVWEAVNGVPLATVEVGDFEALEVDKT